MSSWLASGFAVGVAAAGLEIFRRYGVEAVKSWAVNGITGGVTIIVAAPLGMIAFSILYLLGRSNQYCRREIAIIASVAKFCLHCDKPSE